MSIFVVASRKETEVREVLRARGIHPSAQRVAVALYVLSTKDHPSADEVHRRVGEDCADLSRATVYNTLRLFKDFGLLQELVIAPGHVVFDPRTDAHHHFFDESTGKIIDLPPGAFRVASGLDPNEFELDRVDVVARGRFKGALSSKS